MDFEDFAQQFRKRAAERLTEFEKTLEKAQRDLEKSAGRAAAQAKQEAQAKQNQQAQQTQYGQQGQQRQQWGQAQPGQYAQPVSQNRPLDYRTPDIPGAVKQPQPVQKAPVQQPVEKQQTPAPRKAPGQVKSVLRRG